MNDFLEELRRRRADAMERLNAVEREIQAIDLLLGNASGGDDPMPKRPPSVRMKIARPERIKRQPGDARRLRHAIVEACRRHLLDAEKPIRRADLVALLQRDGVEIPSHNPKTYLSSLLWNHRAEIVNFYEKGYWLADRPLSPLDFKGLKDEQHPLILTRKPGLRSS